MSRVLEYFKVITAIPRCSGKTNKMRDKIIEIARSLSYEVSFDRYGNVLCKKGKPSICLQSHYDMVCLGDFENIELVEKDSILSAKNSTLGADNGMGMAIMFDCMESFEHLECLFTNDEEIGLVGAMNLELEISSSRLLNLDAEEEGRVYVGCAGGVDIVFKLPLEYSSLSADEKIYEISIKDLKGGHSGIDINSGVKSAIKIIAQELKRDNIKLLHVEGGEFRNSIAKSARAIVATSKKLVPFNKTVHIRELEQKKEYIKNSDNIIRVLSLPSLMVLEVLMKSLMCLQKV